MLRIRGEESMQHTGTTARQPYDEKRLADFLARSVWIKLPVPFHLQTRAQRFQNIELQGNFSDQVEPRLVLAGFDQAQQRFKKVALAKVIEAAASFCSLNQVRRNQSRRWNSALFQQCSEAIEKPNWQLRTNLLKRSGGILHCG